MVMFVDNINKEFHGYFDNKNNLEDMSWMNMKLFTDLTIEQLMFMGSHMGWTMAKSHYMMSWTVSGLLGKVTVLNTGLGVGSVKVMASFAEGGVRIGLGFWFCTGGFDRLGKGSILSKAACTCSSFTNPYYWIFGTISNFKELYKALGRIFFSVSYGFMKKTLWNSVVSNTFYSIYYLSSGAPPVAALIPDSLYDGDILSECLSVKIPGCAILDTHFSNADAMVGMPASVSSVVAVRLVSGAMSSSMLTTKGGLAMSWSYILYNVFEKQKILGYFLLDSVSKNNYLNTKMWSVMDSNNFFYYWNFWSDKGVIDFSWVTGESVYGMEMDVSNMSWC